MWVIAVHIRLRLGAPTACRSRKIRVWLRISPALGCFTRLPGRDHASCPFAPSPLATIAVAACAFRRSSALIFSALAPKACALA